MPKGVYIRKIGSKRRCCSEETKRKIGQANSGKNNYRWQYKNVSYSAIHKWLTRTYGKTIKCEKCGNNRFVEWALLKGKKYERKRKNFWRLCRKCHRQYDGIWNKGLRGLQPWHNISGLKYVK
jgi:5-methylcytosine-specific restriction endonuclease McrA